MDQINEQISRILHFDTLDAAEKMTGESCHENKITGFLGMALQVQKSKQMDRLMKATNDTTFSSSVGEYLRIVKDIGFSIVLAEEFVGDNDTPETLYILWDERGLLLRFDTYWGDKVNSATVWYNIIRYDDESQFSSSVLSSGSYERMYAGTHIFRKDSIGLNQHDSNWRKIIGRERFYYDCMVWSGDHDAREALRHKISALESWGSFLPEWEVQPFLWLLHYMDTKEAGYDYRAINAARIEKLPDHVQKAICGKR